MKFPWEKYIELPLERRNTLQIFITNKCNLKCTGCFARNVMGGESQYISKGEYERAVWECKEKGGKQINILGGEPFLHPDILDFIKINTHYGFTTTIYTNGYFLDKYTQQELQGAKIRVSFYGRSGPKDPFHIAEEPVNFDANFMVSSKTTVNELIDVAYECEFVYDCRVFFISSLRELDNERREFFDDTPLTMPVIQYKELVHRFLSVYEGSMDIHVSKRGVFESTVSKCGNKCKFSNYFIGRKIIQCPYDVVNLRFQEDYEFDTRSCQQNNSCLMSKVIYRKRKKDE